MPRISRVPEPRWHGGSRRPSAVRLFMKPKSAGHPEDRLLDVKEAAAMLGLKPSTLYQWAYERRIPVVKLFDRALRFRLSTIQALIRDSERPALKTLGERS